MSEPILKIISQEDAVELTLTRESVRMRLSDSVLQQFRREVDADPDVQSPGLAGRFARAVTGAVGKLLTSYIEYAVYDIESVVERNGTLVFTYHKRHVPSFEDINLGINGRTVSALAAFAPADASQFAEQFAALKAQAQR